MSFFYKIVSWTSTSFVVEGNQTGAFSSLFVGQAIRVQDNGETHGVAYRYYDFIVNTVTYSAPNTTINIKTSGLPSGYLSSVPSPTPPATAYIGMVAGEYDIKLSNGTTLIKIKPFHIDGPGYTSPNTSLASSLALFGRGTLNFGELVLENLIKLTENFSRSTAPVNPLEGQLWFNSSTNSLSVYNGSSWTGVLTGSSLDTTYLRLDGTNSLSGPVKLQNGTSTSPSLTFNSDLDTGIYRIGADQLGIATGGALRLRVDNSGIDVVGTITLNGVEYTWPGSTGSSGQFLTTNGSGGLSWTSSGISFPLLATPIGSATAPAYSFNGDTNTGMYSSGAEELNFTTAGTLRLSIDTTSIAPALPIQGLTGSVTNPTYSFISNDDMGMYRITTNTLGFSTSGIERLRLDGSGRVSIGGNVYSNSAILIRLDMDGFGQTTNHGVRSNIIADTGATSTINGFYSDVVGGSSGSAYTTTNIVGFNAGNAAAGTNQTVTNQHGFFCNNLTTGTDKITAFYGNIASGTNKWNFYAAGTAQNYFNGKVKLSSIESTGLDSSSTLVAASTSTTGHNISLIRYNTDTAGPSLYLGKSKVSTIGDDTIVVNNDTLGNIDFRGNNGTTTFQPAALIRCSVDGTPSSIQMPGKLRFYTTPDGSNSVSERLSIDSEGKVSVHTTDYEDLVTSDDIVPNKKYVDDTVTAAVAGGSLPPGIVLPFAGSSAPPGFLTCNGNAVSRTTYADLFAVIGTVYGVGNGSTTFNVPDLRGKTVAGRGAGSFLTLGGVTGDETVTLTTAQMPAHTHDGSSGAAGAASGGVEFDGGVSGADGRFSVSEPNYYVDNSAFGLKKRFDMNIPSHTHTVSVGSTGSGNSHNNIQPTMALNYIIKT